MTDEQLREALRLLMKVWEEGDKEACEALLAAMETKGNERMNDDESDTGQTPRGEHGRPEQEGHHRAHREAQCTH